MANVVSKILDWLGFRVLATWVAGFIHNLWATIGTETAQSIYNSVSAVNVGMEENTLALHPYLAQRASGALPYTNQPEYAFTAGQDYTLGETMYYAQGGPYIGRIVDQATYDAATAKNMYKAIAVPSLITDTEGNGHTVFPVWQWDETTGKWGFKPKTITYQPNCMYLGGGLDGHLWTPIFSGSETRANGTSGQTMSFSGCTEGFAEVTMFARLTTADNEYLYGYVTAVSNDGGTDTVTIAVVGGEGGEEITEVSVYWEAAA